MLLRGTVENTELCVLALNNDFMFDSVGENDKVTGDKDIFLACCGRGDAQLTLKDKHQLVKTVMSVGRGIAGAAHFADNELDVVAAVEGACETAVIGVAVSGRLVYGDFQKLFVLCTLFVSFFDLCYYCGNYAAVITVDTIF